MEWEEVSRALTFPAHSNFLAMANGERERARAAEKRASICKKFMDLDQHTGQHRDSQDLTILTLQQETDNLENVFQELTKKQ